MRCLRLQVRRRLLLRLAPVRTGLRRSLRGRNKCFVLCLDVVDVVAFERLLQGVNVAGDCGLDVVAELLVVFFEGFSTE